MRVPSDTQRSSASPRRTSLMDADAAAGVEAEWVDPGIQAQQLVDRRVLAQRNRTERVPGLDRVVPRSYSLLRADARRSRTRRRESMARRRHGTAASAQPCLDQEH